MSEEKPDKPRIVVDSDWKEQAAKEKERLAEKADQGTPRGLPPADFITHCASLATQAMIFMGAIANPLTGQADIDFEQARYVIDVLVMLKDKTQGNLKQDEQDTLDSLIGELKLIWVQAQGGSAQA
ncbi:MAG: DUF1844 domain-containing protein [Planctomycetes bacterium]|nr:DUF1844 domain-containing protein [Planctomycetota bacterium]